ncbi:proline-rich protein 7 [Melanotaenia boesemani]|uniref:proline-rich protein 7 n=1 Tax=Melanotaenia boesemani TaxID=1250792 RepID=UPI001C05A64F|nr:proline-rich protein 7 [Melanotaenia boesemani]XP_041865164.1 proline-rich protein 7 [Melanotaenia boesemani]XP_041865166.1 proline-rich protein 7 [Melanotaenia boesemani]XP_041865167.1 proline-rich protein 7 [Melanotaenia boesemani]XP_041865168.1 proline-rich protein 7 [Melanotaenia boesemani]XP_041865169.1 proline-rich protein 7 [Melanotaenia boesemani]
MVMSQGTYTFLACFAGFWLIWAAIVMLCCFCNFLQRRLKRRREERLREQCLRTVEMEPLSCHPAGYPAVPPPPPPQLPRETMQFCPPQTLSPPVPLPVPHPMPQATWVTMPDTDVSGKPPCYEEAVLMEDPPPPYSEVLADPRGGTYLKPAPLRAALPPLRENHDTALVFTSETSKPPTATVFPNRGYSSLIRLPSSQRWDSLGHLLSNMDLNHNNLTPPVTHSLQAASVMATMPRREARTHDGLGLRGGIQGGIQGFQQVHRLRGLEPSCGMPTAFPLLGRSTAV